MKKKSIIAFAILIVIATIFNARIAHSYKKEKEIPMTELKPVELIPVRFSHRQLVWMNALEWCESKARNGAVNWYDKDGTASYYAFQFKPGTLRELGEKYGVIEKGKTDAEIMELLKDYAIQRAIVEFMVEDPGTRWESRFPDCVKNKIGRPPIEKIIK